MKDKITPLKEYLPQNHLKDKKNTPLMGGILMMIIYILGILIFCNLKNPFVWIIIFASISFGGLGFIDDYLKITKKNHFTITTRNKLKIQFLLAFLIIFCISFFEHHQDGTLFISFIKILPLKIGLFYYIIRLFVITGGINGVNLTDGLDGLVSIPVILNLIFFSIIGYFFAFKPEYLKYKIFYNYDYQDIFICCIILIGTLLAFLKYNYKPAKIFMGDVGSMFLGINLSVISLILRQEFLFFICGMLFVIETVTSFIQIFCIRTGRKKPFKMCPIHHHFEFCGWSEKKIVFSFWFVSLLFFIIALLIFIKSYIFIV